MSTLLCYVAYPIDQVGNATEANLLYAEIDDAERGLLAAGMGFYDPGDAFKVAVQDGQFPKAISRVNRVALANSTHVLAFLPKGVPTVGVPIEIERGTRWCSVAIVSDAPGAMLSGMATEHVRIFGQDQTQEAVEWLVAQPVLERDADRTTPLPVTKIGNDPGAQLPTRGYANDAGLDLYVSEDATVPAGQSRDLDCGIAVELPEWTWGLIIGRSSALRTHGLIVNQGVIDADYRGELFVNVFNIRSEPVEIKAGQRIGQLIVQANHTRTLVPTWTDRLSQTERGVRGFGSTG